MNSILSAPALLRGLLLVSLLGLRAASARAAVDDLNVTSYGVGCVVGVDDTPSLRNAAVLASAAGVGIVIPCAVQVRGDAGRISAPIRFEGGGSLNVVTGGSITIAGELVAGLHQIFGAPGPISERPWSRITFDAKVARVVPQWWGAKADGDTDDTAAIQAALDTNRSVFFPQGVYAVSNALTFSAMNNTPGAGRVIAGESMGDGDNRLGLHGAVIKLTGQNNGFVNTDTLPYVTFRDLRISGGPDSGVGIWFTGTVAQSLFQNLNIWTGLQAIYMPNPSGSAPYGQAFANVFINVHGSSHRASPFELYGGPGTTFIGCYAHVFPAASGIAGFRIYNQANLFSCNSVDAGGYAAIIGQSTLAGDKVTTDYNVAFTGMNFESFTIAGVELRGKGVATFRDCTFIGGPGYLASLIQTGPATSTMPITVDRCTFQNGYPGAEWQMNRYYARGAVVQAGASVYVCTNAGVSSASVPFPGGSTGIVDGAARWSYLAPGPSRAKRSELYVSEGGAPNFLVYNSPSLGVQPQADFKGTAIMDVGGSGGVYNVDGVRVLPQESGKVLTGPLILNAPAVNPIGVFGDAVVLGNEVATTVGAAGGAAALPSTPLGYIIANVNGATVKIPYYKQ